MRVIILSVVLLAVALIDTREARSQDQKLCHPTFTNIYGEVLDVIQGLPQHKNPRLPFSEWVCDLGKQAPPEFGPMPAHCPSRKAGATFADERYRTVKTYRRQQGVKGVVYHVYCLVQKKGRWIEAPNNHP